MNTIDKKQLSSFGTITQLVETDHKIIIELGAGWSTKFDHLISFLDFIRLETRNEYQKVMKLTTRENYAHLVIEKPI